MTVWEWAIRPLKLYARFRGRSPRIEYWGFFLLTAVLSVIITWVEMLAGLAENFSDGGPISGLISLALFIPSIAVGVRRLHDIDRSGWWWMLVLLPAAAFGFFGIQESLNETAGFEGLGAPMIVALLMLLGGGILLFLFSILPGTQGPNRFGADPHGQAELEEVFA